MNIVGKTALVIVVASLSFATACSRDKENSGASPETVRGVEILTVQRATLPTYYEAVGTVRAARSAQVGAQTMGNIVRMNVREGDRVSPGQVLAVIDGTQTRAGLERASAGEQASKQDIIAADAELTLAETTLKRYQSLYEKKSVSPHEFDEVKTRYEAAKARRDMARASGAASGAAVAQARASNGFTLIRAPFAGVVTAKLAEVGNLASAGMPVFTVEDTNTFQLETTVDERGIAAVRLGENIPVTLDALGEKAMSGKVMQVLPAADAASRTFVVKIQLPKEAVVRSGLFGRARFPLGEREALAVPQSSLVRRAAMEAVYVVGSDQVASLRYITLGDQSAQHAEVLSGLESGERIIATPGPRELNGKKIEVR